MQLAAVLRAVEAERQRNAAQRAALIAALAEADRVDAQLAEIERLATADPEQAPEPAPAPAPFTERGGEADGEPGCLLPAATPAPPGPAEDPPVCPACGHPPTAPRHRIGCSVGREERACEAALEYADLEATSAPLPENGSGPADTPSDPAPWPENAGDAAVDAPEEDARSEESPLRGSAAQIARTGERNREAVLGLLRQRGSWLAPRDIVRGTDLNLNQVFEALTTLRESEEVEHNGRPAQASRYRAASPGGSADPAGLPVGRGPDGLHPDADTYAEWRETATPRELDIATRILTYVEEHPGARMGQIVEALRTDVRYQWEAIRQATLTLRRLRVLRMEGARGSARYFTTEQLDRAEAERALDLGRDRVKANAWRNRCQEAVVAQLAVQGASEEDLAERTGFDREQVAETTGALLEAGAITLDARDCRYYLRSAVAVGGMV